MKHVAASTCRSCSTFCPVEVTIEDGRVLEVEGDASAPIYEGFICPKGRALAAMHNEPKRLLHSLKRQPDGSYVPISSEQLVQEISAKVAEILAKHGPRAVAAYVGGPCQEHQAAAALMHSFLHAIGSPMFFNNGTIDQPGVLMADALHGTWAGGRMRPDTLDVFMIVGGNPIISKQYFGQDPGRQLKALKRNNTKLIVIDPRRTETARRADVHLQCIPGEDPTIIAGLIHLVIEEGAIDRDFVDLNTRGLESLAQTVKGFTPGYVAERAGISEEDLRKAARIIAEAKRGDFGTGTGPSMATRGTLTNYLMLCLQTLRGFWAREGEEVAHPPVLLPHAAFKAQANSARPAWGFGHQSRVRGLQQTVAGMPTCALPEEILTPGEGQVKALFAHAALALNLPQQELVNEALDTLELLVVHDVDYSVTARKAHYIIATTMPFEMPTITQWSELMGLFHPGYGWVDPYGAYTPALLQHPEGSDLMEAWEIYFRMAQQLKLPMRCVGFLSDPVTAPAFDLSRLPSTDEVYELLCEGSVVPLAEVKKHPHGHVFDEARQTIRPRDADCAARLELADVTMLGELAMVHAEDVLARRKTNQEFPFLYIPRRMQNVTNAAYRPTPSILKTTYNPAFMHPEDLMKLGLHPGDMVEIRSRHGSIIGFVEADRDLRRGVLSMTHGFGKNPGEDYDPRRDGANVNRLLSLAEDYDPYHGMTRMGAVPVAITPLHVEEQRSA